MEILEHNPYLGELVITACRYLGFQDAAKQPLNTNEEIRIAAQMAFSSVAAYLRRKIRAGRVVEIYENVWDRTHLREVPVHGVSSVMIGEDILTPDEDYTVKGNRLELIRESEYFTGLVVKRVFDVRVTYEGGYPSLKNGDVVFNACLLQTLAGYHRRRLYGVTDISRAQGNTIKYSSAKGGLTEEVEQILQNEVCYVEPDLESYEPLPPYYPCYGYVEPDLESMEIYSLWKDDVNTAEIAEEAAQPGFSLTFKFMDVSPDFCQTLWINARYTGDEAHVVKVKLRNTATGQLDPVTEAATDFTFTTGFQLYTFFLPSVMDSYVADNTLTMVIEHESAGNPLHMFTINSMVITQ